MNPVLALAGSDPVRVALALALLALAPLALAGVALLNTGLGRSRSAAQSLTGSLCIVAISVVVFISLGASFASPERGAVFSVVGISWNWIGLGPWMLGSFRSAPLGWQMGALFECFAAAFVVFIPWGAGADRTRLAAGCASAVVLAGVVFPLLAHWVWGAGWLAPAAPNGSGLPAFLDPAGAATVHALGGLSALAIIWIAGPRKGKFPREGLATAMPAHNTVLVLFGCLAAMVGWLAWNMAGDLLWMGAGLGDLALTALNTVLAASGALLTTLVVTRIRFGKPDASLCANGWLAGLVTSCACAAIASPAEALFVGAIAGVFTPMLVEVLELALSIDDPTGAISVHAAGGLWGLFAAGLFAPHHGQLLAQLVGIAAILGIFLPLVFALFALLNRFVPFRVDADGERLGMDLHELGGGAYPEFVLHRDESYR